ncbi:MAG: hypothetical protein ACREQL_08005, partial [Candidatus Binatia bacterium]
MATGVLAYVGLHFVEPALAITWSFGHLHRQPLLPVLAGGAVVLVPLLVMCASRSPAWHVAARPLSPRNAILLALGLFALLGGLETLLPVFPPGGDQPGGDQWYFLETVRGTFAISRWCLASWSLNRLVTLVTFATGLPGEGRTLPILVTYINVAIGAVGLTALAGAARALGQTRGETTIITLLAWTTFGTLQLAAGYVDVYPVALTFTALYLWTAMRAVRGAGALAWPLAIAAMGPFWYEGLALLAPSALLVAIVVARRPGGARGIAAGIAAAVVAAGIATVPPYGVPFAWRAFAANVAGSNAYQYGYSATSSLVPWEDLATTTHLREVLHTVILVDGVGVLAVLVLGVAFARRVVSEPE